MVSKNNFNLHYIYIYIYMCRKNVVLILFALIYVNISCTFMHYDVSLYIYEKLKG